MQSPPLSSGRPCCPQVRVVEAATQPSASPGLLGWETHLPTARHGGCSLPGSACAPPRAAVGAPWESSSAARSSWPLGPASTGTSESACCPLGSSTLGSSIGGAPAALDDLGPSALCGGSRSRRRRRSRRGRGTTAAAAAAAAAQWQPWRRRLRGGGRAGSDVAARYAFTAQQGGGRCARCFERLRLPGCGSFEDDGDHPRRDVPPISVRRACRRSGRCECDVRLAAVIEAESSFSLPFVKPELKQASKLLSALPAAAAAAPASLSRHRAARDHAHDDCGIGSERMRVAQLGEQSLHFRRRRRRLRLRFGGPCGEENREWRERPVRVRPS